MRGYYGIGVYHPKHEINIGGLWRTAGIYDAAFLFTIGRRYKPQASDTLKTFRHMPLYHYLTFEEMYDHLPHVARLVCVELTPNATPLPEFEHPEQAVYLLGAEDHGIPTSILDDKIVVSIPYSHPSSLNVATAGAIVLYDRYIKRVKP